MTETSTDVQHGDCGRPTTTDACTRCYLVQVQWMTLWRELWEVGLDGAEVVELLAGPCRRHRRFTSTFLGLWRTATTCAACSAAFALDVERLVDVIDAGPEDCCDDCGWLLDPEADAEELCNLCWLRMRTLLDAATSDPGPIDANDIGVTVTAWREAADLDAEASMETGNR